MSLMRNLAGAFFPHLENKTSSGRLPNTNSFLLHDVNGDGSAAISIDAVNFDGNYKVQGSVDGVAYFDLAFVLYPPSCTGTTEVLAGQPMTYESLFGTSCKRVACVATGGLKKLRVILSNRNTGYVDVTINSYAGDSFNSFVNSSTHATKVAFSQGIVGASNTLMLPSEIGLRHYLLRLDVTVFVDSDVALGGYLNTVTTTNLPNNPQLNVMLPTCNTGWQSTQSFVFDSGGLAATAAGTSTSFTASPATGQMVFNLTAIYRLGL